MFLLGMVFIGVLFISFIIYFIYEENKLSKVEDDNLNKRIYDEKE